MGESRGITMKLYVVLVDDYRENWEPEVYLNGVFDSYDRAKEYVLENYKDKYFPDYDKTIDNFANNYIKEVELNNPCDIIIGGYAG